MLVVSSLSEGEMSATNRVVALENLAPQPETTGNAATKPARVPEIPAVPRVPALRVMPLLRDPQPNRFVRVPTHAVGVHTEQRERPRASLKLPLPSRSSSRFRQNPFPLMLFWRSANSRPGSTTKRSTTFSCGPRTAPPAMTPCSMWRAITGRS